MDIQHTIILLLNAFVRSLPQFVVIGIGIFLCFSNRAKYPKASKTALGGLIVLLVSDLLGLLAFVLQVYLPLWLEGAYQTAAYIGFVIGFILSAISAIGLGLVIYAVWIERRRE